MPVASVNAPLTWPNSSDSSSVSGIAAQLTLTNGMSRCALRWCTARATSSLPVPVSPVISTVLRVAATSSMRPITSAMARLRPDDALRLTCDFYCSAHMPPQFPTRRFRE